MADRHFSGLLEFAGFLEKQVAEVEVAVAAAARISADVLYDNAHRVYGDQSKLAPLAPATQQERSQLGYSPDEPLLRDGTLLRDNVEKHSDPYTGAIGSSEPVQMYHEYGYINARTGTNVPPRPVFKIALDESEPEVLELQQGVISISLGFGAAGLLKLP